MKKSIVIFLSVMVMMGFASASLSFQFNDWTKKVVPGINGNSVSDSSCRNLGETARASYGNLDYSESVRCCRGLVYVANKECVVSQIGKSTSSSGNGGSICSGICKNEKQGKKENREISKAVKEARKRLNNRR